jgi:hypothetical protein
MTSPRRDRTAPPRFNPEPAPTQPTFRQQLAEVPWGVLILTAVVTSVAGGVALEIVRGVVNTSRKRKEKLEGEVMGTAPRAANAAPGTRPDGSFSLPTPDYYGGSIYHGFAQPADVDERPPLTDVSTPVGQLQHEVRAMQQQISRIEKVLIGRSGHEAA